MKGNRYRGRSDFFVQMIGKRRLNMITGLRHGCGPRLSATHTLTAASTLRFTGSSSSEDQVGCTTFAFASKIFIATRNRVIHGYITANMGILAEIYLTQSPPIIIHVPTTNLHCFFPFFLVTFSLTFKLLTFN